MMVVNRIMNTKTFEQQHIKMIYEWTFAWENGQNRQA